MIQQLLHQLVSFGLLLGVEGDRRCDQDSRLIDIGLQHISLLLDHLIRHFLADLGHEARLTIIEVVVEQAQVLLVLLLHRVEHPRFADLNPYLVFLLFSLFALGGRAWVFFACLLVDHANLVGCSIRRGIGGLSLRIFMLIIFGSQ